MPRTQPGPRLVAVALVLGALAIAGCSGKTTGASNFNSSNNTIRLNAVGSCDTSCTAFMRYRVVGVSAWTNTPSFTVPNKVTNAPWSRTVTISPGTRYEYQACGKEASQSQFFCVGPDGTGSTTERFTAAIVGCGQVITQNTTVGNDVGRCSGHGLVIGAPNITLDLNGHSVTGDQDLEILCEGPTAGDFGIDNSAGHDGLTIKNGRIGDFEQGVVLTNADDNVVHHVDVHGYPIFCQGIYSEGGDRAHIHHATVSGARIRSIAVEQADGAVIESNTISDPRHVGVNLVATNSRVASNTVSSSTGETDFAIELLAGGNNEVVGNTVNGADGDGIVLAIGADDNFLALNTVSNVRNDLDPGDPGQFAGIEVVDGGARNRIVGNVLFNNQAPGIAIGLPLSGASSTSATTVSNNTVRDNTGDGIVVGTLATGTVIQRNTALRNGDDGIDVDVAGTTITANTANSNTDWGIEAVAGVTDGGGNRASGNGRAAQCLNLSCSP